MPHPKVKLSDDSGNAVGVTSNRLDVNAYLSATPTIDIGDVSLLLGGTAASTNAGTMDAQTLRVTLATDDTHWGTVGTAADSDGTAHGQLRYISDKANTIATNSGTGNTSLSTISGYLSFALSTTGGQYAEGDGGFLATGVRNDTLASLVSVDHDHAPFQVNASGALYVEVASSTTLTVNSHAVTNAGTFAVQAGHDITGMVSGSNPDIGTSAEILRSLGNVACKRVDVIASSANTGIIWVGGSNLTADSGIPLSPGDFYSVDVDGTSDIYVLAAVNGESVYFNYFT